jgi:3-oxoacyl-[acyl-carrier protein] reductase
MKKLEGKAAIVSGSGRGIGRAIALKLASEGANVIINDLDEQPALETAELIEAAGGKAVTCIGDVTASDFPERFVDAAVSSFGGLDIIVNNAGYTWDSVIQKMSDDQWQAILDVHLTAPFKILRAASEVIRGHAKLEIERDGVAAYRKVVNISSISGLYGNAGQANYGAAKSAMIGLTRTMAKEWGRYNVNVNCVAFGLIETRMTEALNKDEQKTATIGDTEIKMGIQAENLEMIKRLTPLGRAGTAEEAADAVYLFCAPESNFISGQVLVAGGGLLI